VNTHRLNAFDSPNFPSLAHVGISIEEASHLFMPQARGALRVHRSMDTRLLAVRLVPGFDDLVLRSAITNTDIGLRAVVLQLYGTGNLPSAKSSLLETLTEARERGILVVATTQCPTGAVMLGKYAVGHALASAGVVSGGDMTLEAASTKLAYLFGRGDLSLNEIAELMLVPLRGEVSPPSQYNEMNVATSGLFPSLAMNSLRETKWPGVSREELVSVRSNL
jgi:L-asparaginase